MELAEMQSGQFDQPQLVLGNYDCAAFTANNKL